MVFAVVVFLAAAFLVVVFFAAVFFAAVFLAVVFLAAVFFADFLAVFLTGPRARLSASSSAARSSEIVVDRVVLAQRRVRLAIGHVRTEATLLHHHRLAGLRVRAQLLQRRRRGPAPTLLRLGVDLQRFLEGDVEHLVLGLQRPRVRALLQVRPVAPVLRGDLLVGRGSLPTTRGSDSSFIASSRSMLSSAIDFSSDPVRGLALFGASSGSTSVTYGPNRPAFATT